MTAADETRKLTTILFIDAVGYSAAAERDQVSAARGVAALRERVFELAAKHGGRVFNTAGDGFMLDFPLASSAVRAAITLLDEAAAPNTALPRVHAGAHLGEVMITGDDLLGHGVNVAARLLAQAEPNTLVISEAVKAQLRGEIQAPFAPLGRIHLPKMREAVVAHAYVPESARPDWRQRLMTIAKRRRRVLVAGAAALAGVAVAAIVLSTRETSYFFEPMQMIALSRREEFHPALSPDGRFIAYVVNNGNNSNYDTELVMRPLSGGEETALTDSDDYNEYLPAFSPNGERLAYARWRKSEESSLCEIMVRELPHGLDRRVGVCQGLGTNRIGWTADGRAIVFTDEIGGGDETSHIRTLDLETAAVRDLVPPAPRGMGDRAPTMSPDGTRVAFMRYETPDRADVYVYNTASRRLTRVTDRGEWAQVAWADALNLFVITRAASNATEMSLLRADGRGTARPQLPALALLFHPVTAQGVLALQVETTAANLWRSGPRGATAITDGNQVDGEPDFSRDGTLAFLSWHAGVWIVLQAPGEQPRRLAELTGRDPTGLRWSPDGRRLVFSGEQDGRSRLFIIDAASGVVQPVRLNLDEEVANPAWSPDGRSLVFASTHPQGPRLMRVALDATAPQPISGPGWIAAIETREGLFALNREQPGIWRLAPGRAPELVLPEFRPEVSSAVLFTGRQWVVSSGRFYIMDEDAEGRGRIRYRAIAGGPMVHVTDLDDLSGGSLAVDPTTGDVVYQVAAGEPQSDIAIIRYRRN